MKDDNKLTEADLRQFTGSEHWYRHGLVRNVLFTDGAKYVADHRPFGWVRGQGADDVGKVGDYLRGDFTTFVRSGHGQSR